MIFLCLFGSLDLVTCVFLGNQHGRTIMNSGSVWLRIREINRKQLEIEELRNDLVDKITQRLTVDDKKVIYINRLQGETYVIDTFLKGKKECQLCGYWLDKYRSKEELETAISGLRKSLRGLISVRFLYGVKGFVTLRLRVVKPR